MKTFYFSAALLNWYDQHGRKNLPWQQNPSAYHVWLSEIMLQQTQVTTVIDYYSRFIQQLPTIDSLAQAEEDDVLALWSGLGYYSRARNLHKTAKIIADTYQGVVPENLDDLIALPGIGRSTAGAILSLAYHQPVAILDGNVKRVLTRYQAISGWPGHRQVEQQLWQIAEELLPEKRIANYIQAQMDLGATLCTRTNPNCTICPIQTNCKAYQQGEPTLYPTKKVKKTSPVKTVNWLVLVDHNNDVLLEQRPPQGIWAKLWALPEKQSDDDIKTYCQQKWGVKINNVEKLEVFTHIFTHFKLNITPYKLSCNISGITEPSSSSWYAIDEALTLGIPAPVKSLLKTLR